MQEKSIRKWRYADEEHLMPEYRGGWALCQERTHEPNSPVDRSRELSYRLLAERPFRPDTTYRTANRRTPLRSMR